MTKSVLLLGLKDVIVDDVKDHLQMPDVQLFADTGIDDVRTAFGRTSIDSVIMVQVLTWRPVWRSFERSFT